MMLMEKAEKIALEEHVSYKISVISGRICCNVVPCMCYIVVV